MAPRNKQSDTSRENENQNLEDQDLGESKEQEIPTEGDMPRTVKGEIDVTPVDPYTHEPLSPFPEGDIPIEDMEVDSFAEVTSDVPLEDEGQAMDFVAIDSGANTDAVMDEIDDYTEDPDTLSDFAERQELATGSDELLTGLVEHNALGPTLSSEDVDADWEAAEASGEETAGATVPTPDQSIVEDVGEAWGIEYADDEELGTADKIGENDENRYELDEESLENYENDLRTGDESREDDMELDEF